jgi:hypothetical protein
MAPVDDWTVPSWRVLLAGGRLPECLPSASRTADEWMKEYRRRWRAERLLTADGGLALPGLRVQTF